MERLLPRRRMTRRNARSATILDDRDCIRSIFGFADPGILMFAQRLLRTLFVVVPTVVIAKLLFEFVPRQSAEARKSTAGISDPAAQVTAAITIQDAEGVSEADLDLNALKQMELTLVQITERKMRAVFKRDGLDPATAKFEIDGSSYVIVGGKKLAFIKARLGSDVREVWILGFHQGQFLRVTCYGDTGGEDIPYFYGPCGQKIKEAFGVTLNPEIGPSSPTPQAEAVRNR
jgi:hypothetical protein